MGRKKKIMLAAGLLLLFLSAFFTGQSNRSRAALAKEQKSVSEYKKYPLRNPIEPGKRETYERQVTVKNYNSVPCRVGVFLKKAEESVDLVCLHEGREGYNRKDWTYSEETGIYSYKNILNPGETTENLIDQITVQASETARVQNLKEDFLIVYEETVESQDLKEHTIENFEITLQNPELPTGCEITAMTMVLRYYGLEADKMEMALTYLPRRDYDVQMGSDGKYYGSDLNRYFIGDPREKKGYVCGTGAVVTAANRFLKKEKSSLRAVDITGTQPEELYSYVSRDVPVVVWVTTYMNPRKELHGWYTPDGDYVQWSKNDHGAVLVGYTEDTVTIADPITGLTEYEKERFEKVFASRENQCVILEPCTNQQESGRREEIR